MASMKDIKTRIRSVESTQQITRAMELVATSKLRHARERVERSRPFHEVLGEAIAGIQAGLKETPSVYSEVRPVKKTCFVVIGGDRGLAGGYNANLHRLVLSLAGSEPYCVLPIGKKPLEQFTRSGAELVSTYFGLAASVGIGDCMQIARLLCDGFAAGRYDRVTVVYTEFRSMLSQVPASADVLPLQLTGDAKYQSATVEDDPAALVAAIVPQYVSGVLYSALCEASASEHGARRTAMNAAASASAAETAMPVTGGLSINTDSHQVFRDGTPLELTTREYELLTFLASHPNKVYSRIDLMEQVWNYGYVGDDQRTVDVTVRRLREKIETDPANPKYILTRRGVGYYFAV